MTDARTYPVKPGDWVASRHDPSCVARVRDVGFDPVAQEAVVDLVLYARDGRKIGRESPVMGGPRSYEPACSYSNWRRISKPGFPLSLEWVDNGDGTRHAGYASGNTLPDREWRRPQAALPAARPTHMARPNYDPESEAAGRRLAAQELREAARLHGVPSLADKAEELEREADLIAPRSMAP